MANFYMDYVNGDDANDGLGWWKVAYTNGTGAQPAAGETATGSVSGSTAIVISVTGTWAVSGTIYWYGKSAAFQAETLNFTGGGACTIAGDFSVSSIKTIDGFTATMSAPGDILRIAKSADPVSLGVNATFTNDSATVTLASAVTTNVETCDGATGDWVASANVTEVKETSTYKEGTGARRLTIAAAFVSGIIAYKNIATLDLSGKQKISFSIRSSIDIAAGKLRLDLCSDDAGATPVNSFTINQILYASKWYNITLDPDAGAGNLGNAIESVALYAVSDPGIPVIFLDNIIACTTNGLNLQSFIGKNAAGERFWPIKSINDTAVILGHPQKQGTAVNLYYGTTETVAAYLRETIKTTVASTNTTPVFIAQESGTEGSLITFSGGWNPVNNTQDGETWFDGSIQNGYLTFSKDYIAIDSKVAFCDYYRFYLAAAKGQELDFTMVGLSSGIYFWCSDAPVILDGAQFIACDTGILIQYGGTLEGNCKILGGGSGITIAGGFIDLIDSILAGNSSYDIYNNSGQCKIDLRNTKLASTTEVSIISSGATGSSKKSCVCSQKHDTTAGNHRSWKKYGTIVIDTVIFDTTPSTRLTPVNASNKLECTVAKVAVDSAGDFTISAKVRESVVGDGTDYNGNRIRLIVKKNTALGISADTVLDTATVASEGAFETISGSLSGASISPTDNGVVEIVVDCDGTTGWINIDTITLT